MVKKKCPKCGKHSYSAATRGKWICASCGKDLTKIPYSVLDDADRGGEKQKRLLTLVTSKPLYKDDS